MAGLHWQRRWDPFRELQREVGRLFESLDPFQASRRVEVYPPLNLYDASDRYILSAQLPGVAPGEIELTITGETLTMRGERKRADGIKDDSYRRQERPMGRWSRTVTLPDRVEERPGNGVVRQWDPHRKSPQGGGRQAASHRSLSGCRGGLTLTPFEGSFVHRRRSTVLGAPGAADTHVAGIVWPSAMDLEFRERQFDDSYQEPIHS